MARFAKAACMAIILILVWIVTAGDFQEAFVYQAFQYQGFWAIFHTG